MTIELFSILSNLDLVTDGYTFHICVCMYVCSFGSFVIKDLSNTTLTV